VPSIIDVNPIYGRAVLFSSNNLPHRVLPAKSECRYCISFFFFGDSVFPLPEVLPSDIASILSPSAEHNIIHEMFKLKYQDDSKENNDQNLKAYMLKIKQNYPEVLCALIHTKEYYMSLAQSFTDVKFNNDDDFHVVTAQIPNEVVSAAMIFFKNKCDNLAQTVDSDYAEYIEVAKAYIRNDFHKQTVTIQ
jgi:hypothetical protein